MAKFPMTVEGRDKLQTELKHLINEERPINILTNQQWIKTL